MLCGGRGQSRPQVAGAPTRTARRDTGAKGANGWHPVEIAGPSWRLSAAGGLVPQSGYLEGFI